MIFNIKKYIHSIAKIVFVAGLLLSITSCREEISESQGENESRTTGISFFISNQEEMGFSSKAMDVDREGYMSNLYVVALRDKDGAGNVVSDDNKIEIFSLNPTGHTYVVGDINWNKYDITLYPGTYRFYVFANIDLYLERATTVSDFRTEDEIKKMYLNFKSDVPLVPLHLPMMCLPSQISTNASSPEGSGADVSVTITENTTPTIYATMRFLCAKVRYTILYNNNPGGCSEDFGNYSMRFNVDAGILPAVSFIRKKTFIFPDYISSEDKQADEGDPFIKTTGSGSYRPGTDEEITTEMGYWNLDLGRYNWNETEGENYPKSPGSSLTPWENSLDDWKQQKRRVWQGVVYLPENDNDTKTMLAFPYVLDRYDDGFGNYYDGTAIGGNYKVINLFDALPQYAGSSSKPGIDYSGTIGGSTGLKRGYMYDVVAKVTNPDDIELDIEVYINVEKWHNIDQTLSDGDLKYD